MAEAKKTETTVAKATETKKTVKGIREKLTAIQTCIKAPKNLYNSHGNFNYRNAEGILEAVKPYLAKHDCSLTVEDNIVAVADRIYVEATATLTDNATEKSISVKAYAREALERKGMDTSQLTGATSSYARKYALNGLFLLDDTKDADTDEFVKQTTEPAGNKPAQTQATKTAETDWTL